MEIYAKDVLECMKEGEEGKEGTDVYKKVMKWKIGDYVNIQTEEPNYTTKIMNMRCNEMEGEIQGQDKI